MSATDVFIDSAPHVAPEITVESRDFWTGGASGELRICKCAACGTYNHPPSPVCRRCRSMDIKPDAVSGEGVLASFSVNYHKWFADFDGPYVAALVELNQCPGVRLITNLIGCRISEIKVGMPVTVVFKEVEGAYLPIFKPSSR